MVVYNIIDHPRLMYMYLYKIMELARVRLLEYKDKKYNTY